MNKIDKLEHSINQVSKQIRTYEAELVERRSKLNGYERHIADLRLQQALEPEREAELDKEIAKLNKPISGLENDIRNIEEKLRALKEARSRQLDPIREEAKEYLSRELDKREREINAEIHDIRLIRAAVIERLLKIGNMRREARDMRDRFVHLSSVIDGNGERKYSDRNFPLNFPTFHGLSSTTAGNHSAILPIPQECVNAYEYAIAPEWYEEYKLSGDIVSSAEINTRRARRSGQL
ncbi:hypothetical protein AB6A23_18745 [Paenibacillus tarimensis]